MPTVTHVQTNFTGGEWTPRLLGRTDLAKYPNACKILENFMVMPHGGIIRRSGTRFVAEVKFSSRDTRLIPFTFSNEQSYVIEFGHQYVRFYRDRGVLLDGVNPLEVVSPYQEAQLRGIWYTQSADILFLTHDDIQPQELQRLADTNWQFVDFDFIDGPYLNVNTTTTTLAPGAVTGSGIAVVASSTTGINGGDGFLATDVGRLVRIKVVANFGFAEIVTVVDTKNITVDIKEDFDGTAATTAWRLGAWSDTTGWPRISTFHQERLWFGGTKDQPQTLWGSKVGDFNNFEPSAADGTVRDDDGVTFTIADERVNVIKWMVSALRGMVIGTSDGEFLLQSRGAFDPITPTDVAVNRQTPYGSRAGLRAPVVGPSVLFIQRDGRKVREFAFSFNLDQYTAPDLNLLAEHITTAPIRETAYMLSPETTLWVILTDGTLLGMTYMREQDIVSWHRHPIGGSSGSGGALVESVVVIPDDPHDLTWLVVCRTINGSSKRFVEFIEDRFDIGDKQELAFFVDAGLSKTGAASTTVSGLSHLEGETVKVLVDGATHPDQTVSGGSITLDDPASDVQVGLGYTSKIETLPIFPERAPIDPRGKFKGTFKALLEFHQTLGGVIGNDEDELQPITFRLPVDPMDSPPPLFTGTIEEAFTSGQDRVLSMIYQQTDPLPATLLAFIFELDLGGS